MPFSGPIPFCTLLVCNVVQNKWIASHDTSLQNHDREQPDSILNTQCVFASIFGHHLYALPSVSLLLTSHSPGILPLVVRAFSPRNILGRLSARAGGAIFLPTALAKERERERGRTAFGSRCLHRGLPGARPWSSKGGVGGKELDCAPSSGSPTALRSNISRPSK